jgi:hypothetical protein
MARAIVRYSFDGDRRASRQAIRDALRAAGFVRIGTGSFEADAAALGPLVAALKTSLDVAADPPEGELDHLWIYIDRGAQDD